MPKKKNLQNSGIVNDFDIKRVYVNIQNKLSGNASSKVTFDVARNATTPTTLNSFLKYAYVDLHDALPAELQIIPTDLTVSIGLLPTYWIGYVNSILGIRYVSIAA
ncbi:MAG: hypothetical protein KJ732_08050 [Candidatus Margulisbacteria bacterium]|nr:hypothetical protein [Candidatus Margulisiibacteriota bacterium]